MLHFMAYITLHKRIPAGKYIKKISSFVPVLLTSIYPLGIVDKLMGVIPLTSFKSVSETPNFFSNVTKFTRPYSWAHQIGPRPSFDLICANSGFSINISRNNFILFLLMTSQTIVVSIESSQVSGSFIIAISDSDNLRMVCFFFLGTNSSSSSTDTFAASGLLCKKQHQVSQDSYWKSMKQKEKKLLMKLT
jgi:hypothetical protein